MKVLVVGGAGYIGGSVTDLLLETEHEVVVYDALVYEDQYRKPARFIYGDVREQDKLGEHIDWADAVIWLAALVGDGACALMPDVATEINEHCVQWLAGRFAGKIVFLSTCSVYGAQDDILTEDSPTKPLSVYAATKLRAESSLADCDAITFRLGTLYGLGDCYSRIRADLVVNTLVLKAHTIGKLTVYGGDQYRPLLHVRDAARAVVGALDSDARGVFNLHAENTRIIDLAEQVVAAYPEAVLERTELTFEDARNYRVSSAKAEETLGFEPLHSVEFGIEQIKELLAEGRIKDVNNARYSNHQYLETHFAGTWRVGAP